MFTRALLSRAGFGVVLLLALLALTRPVCADETDNFYLPLEPDFADLGGFLEALHTRALEESVRVVNNRIERALNLKDPVRRARALARVHEPDLLAEVVIGQFGSRLTETLRIEGVLQEAWARRSFPGQILVHSDISMNLHGRPALDPRAVLMLFQAGTIKAFGVYFGTDKLLHFHQLGYGYYTHYRSLRRGGVAPDAAREAVLAYFGKEALLAEENGFGTITTGIFSNADMAANHAGFQFFLNLTEPIVFLGRRREPLVVRCGAFWRVNDQVRPESGWFGTFISDHWNEALNPNLYSSSTRPHVRKILEERAAHIVEFYTRKDGRPRDPAYFDELARKLSTQGGEAYGHSGQFDQLMTIGNTCLPALREGEAAGASGP
jgi:hypothetical protein